MSATIEQGAESRLITVRKEITFTGAANLGAVGAVPLFDITGRVTLVTLSAFCTTSLTEAGVTATIELGVTGDTNLLVAVMDAKDIDENDWWVTTTGTPAGIAIPATHKDILLSADIIATVGAQAVDGGVVQLVARYLQETAGASLVAA